MGVLGALLADLGPLLGALGSLSAALGPFLGANHKVLIKLQHTGVCCATLECCSFIRTL